MRAGKRLALATKEVLVAAGPLLLAEARTAKAGYKWEEAEGFLDGALALLGFQVGQ